MSRRPVHLKIDNRTSYSLHKKGVHIEHGKLEDQPPTTIPAGTCSATWTACEKSGALIGPKGSVTYSLTSGRLADHCGEDIELTFTWNHPFNGATSSYTISSQPEGRIAYQLDPQDPKGHEQHITFYPALVHSYTPVDTTHWMSDLADDVRLDALTIPGTHDTGARLGGSLAECQTMTLTEQLNAGIRFLDIRCKKEGDRLRIYHGPVDQELHFDSDIQANCLRFLESHPGECIVMLVSNEGSADKNIAELFWQALKGHHAQWYLSNRTPTLGEVRGKIVLLRRFALAGGEPENATGIDLSQGWKDDATFEIDLPQGDFKIQDRYKVPTLFNIKDKWHQVESLLVEAGKGPEGTWYLNYTSGASAGAHPIDVARGTPGIEGVNGYLQDYLFHTQDRFLGTLVMDFPEQPGGLQLIDTLIALNSPAKR